MCQTYGSDKSKPDSIHITEQNDCGTPKKILILCSADRVGHGDDALGQKLMTNLIRTLEEMGDELWCIVFVNNGVKLTITGSDVLEDLQEYERRGIRVLVCGTCLSHFNLAESKEAGKTTNMVDIVTSMQLADSVINL